MITDIQKDKNGYFFAIGKCIYRCDDYDSLCEVKNELIKSQFHFYRRLLRNPQGKHHDNGRS